MRRPTSAATAGPVVLAEAAEGVLTITIARAHARNAVDHAVAAGLAHALARLEAEPRWRVGVITGAGGHFCAGMDLKAFARGELPVIDPGGFAGFVETPPGKPLIAAVEGYALAGGFEIALACDLIVAARGARFGLPEVRRGLAAGAGGLLRLPARLPYHLAMELALTGRQLPAPEAARHGLVNRLAEDGQALAVAQALAAEVAQNAPLAVIASKRVIAHSRNWAHEEMFRRQQAIVEPVTRSADAREGATAFAQKRPPTWQGR